MADDVVIRVEGLGKKYAIGHQAERERYTALRDVMARGAKGLWRKAADMARGRAIVAGDTVEEFWALKDVSFEVKRGEVLGIIGRNGAGKSTLLKILSRITEPSEGRVAIKGRVASLLEVGTGFHPELTGRENIYLNGAILGMSRVEIRRKFNEIVAFAEVGKFLDTPVKRYSSGMYVRLAFAVAAHLEPDILVVDEVLAVGDAAFQKKCLGKMKDVADGGRTVLFVSHQLHTIAALCGNVCRFEEGRLVALGPASTIINGYLFENENALAAFGMRLGPSLWLKQFSCRHGQIVSGGDQQLELRLHVDKSVVVRCMQILVYSEFGMRVGILDLRRIGLLDHKMNAGELWVRLDLHSVPLTPGRYRLGLYIFDSDHMSDYNDLLTMVVEENPRQYGFVASPPQYRGVTEFEFAGAYESQLDHASSVYKQIPY